MAQSLTILQRLRFVLVLPLILGALLTSTQKSSAHPLGNFTVNQYTRIELTADELSLVYILDMAEVPAFQTIQQIDLNGDGEIDTAESGAWLDATLPEIASDLHLTLAGVAIPLRAENPTVIFPEGEAGLSLLRLQTRFVPAEAFAFGDVDQELNFQNTYQTDRLGWREIVVTHGDGIAVEGVELPTTDASHELTAYPADLLLSPLDQTERSFSVRQLAGAPAAASFATFQKGVAQGNVNSVNRPNGGTTGGRFAALLDKDDLSKTGIAVALLAAMLWGAAHALSPGHGKTVVGAYLIGSRGTPRHAAFLGFTVTITHTAGVVALGLVTLFASRYIVPETIFPWLSVASGVLVVVMGLWTLQMRLRGESALGHHHRHHDHGHDHDHAHSFEHDDDHAHDGHTHSHGGHTHSHVPPAEISWRGLLALGISGGLIPCPSALLVLLGAVALGRIGFGLALVVAFSLGLAATLTGLGLLFLYAGQLLERRIAGNGRVRTFLRFAPAVGSVALTLAGIAIVIRALEATSLL